MDHYEIIQRINGLEVRVGNLKGRSDSRIDEQSLRISDLEQSLAKLAGLVARMASHLREFFR